MSYDEIRTRVMKVLDDGIGNTPKGTETHEILMTLTLIPYMMAQVEMAKPPLTGKEKKQIVVAAIESVINKHIENSVGGLTGEFVQHVVDELIESIVDVDHIGLNPDKPVPAPTKKFCCFNLSRS